MAIEVPPLLGPHREAWVAVLEVATRFPEDWTLVGGQMVLLHCWERGRSPARLTEDADDVVDVRSRPPMLRVFTAVLADIGFTSSAGVSPSGHEHRWRRGEAQIDVLLPDGIGERAARRPGSTGSTTVQTPGGSAALRHSESVAVRMGEVEADVPRPHLAGALLAKATAFRNGLDRHRDRHALDVAVLGTMVGAADAAVLRAVAGKGKARTSMLGVVGYLQAHRPLWVGVDGADPGLDRIRLALGG